MVKITSSWMRSTILAIGFSTTRCELLVADYLVKESIILGCMRRNNGASSIASPAPQRRRIQEPSVRLFLRPLVAYYHAPAPALAENQSAHRTPQAQDICIPSPWRADPSGVHNCPTYWTWRASASPAFNLFAALLVPVDKTRLRSRWQTPCHPAAGPNCQAAWDRQSAARRGSR
ncbi:hypothetical protein DAEQUDRAFT_116485 [Daedalea quercina L-15889]|uniref:Uncharacterized protein n=1 Tax=Daedalea quercina L-15889 TaxID=1314783 RepID=A0A165KSZ8_9APHY|nr:hypothetical protein DAEQUDRAFT_116485 [Daedalea quercina L-15889]